MLARVTTHWWVFLIRGVLSIVVGVVALALPGATALTVALLFAAFALVEGISSIVAAVRMTHEGSRWIWLLIGGIASVAFGAVAAIYPGLSLLYLSIIIGVWAIVTGCAEIASAWKLRSMIAGELLWIVAGIVSILFGIVVLFQPAAGVVFIVYAVAFYAFLAGIAFVALAFRLRARHGVA